MRELYIEGLATHGGPESCAVVREGAGEALTGVRAGRAMEPRDQGDRGNAREMSGFAVAGAASPDGHAV